MAETSPPTTLTKREFADALRVSTRTVDRYIKAQLIRASKTPGGHVRIDRDELDRLRS